MKTVLVHAKPISSAPDSPPARRRANLAARVGRWSAAHWKTATFGWLALVLVAFAVGGQVGTKQADPTKAALANPADGQDPRRRVQGARERERPG